MNKPLGSGLIDIEDLDIFPDGKELDVTDILVDIDITLYAFRHNDRVKRSLKGARQIIIDLAFGGRVPPEISEQIYNRTHGTNLEI